MKCPYCSNHDTRVVDSRSFDEGAAIRRRRHCDGCGGRFTTFERIDTIPLAVVKRNQTRETFDRVKILNGIIKSCNKRPVTMEQMEKMVDGIEQAALNSMTKEISSSEIGDMVMEQLKEIDRVAYVRFASVYRQFKDIDSFLEELSQLLQDNKA